MSIYLLLNQQVKDEFQNVQNWYDSDLGFNPRTSFIYKYQVILHSKIPRLFILKVHFAKIASAVILLFCKYFSKAATKLCNLFSIQILQSAQFQNTHQTIDCNCQCVINRELYISLLPRLYIHTSIQGLTSQRLNILTYPRA